MTSFLGERVHPNGDFFQIRQNPIWILFFSLPPDLPLATLPRGYFINKEFGYNSQASRLLSGPESCNNPWQVI